jgi:hypothetical protein
LSIKKSSRGISVACDVAWRPANPRARGQKLTVAAPCYVSVLSIFESCRRLSKATKCSAAKTRHSQLGKYGFDGFNLFIRALPKVIVLSALITSPIVKPGDGDFELIVGVLSTLRDYRATRPSPQTCTLISPCSPSEHSPRILGTGRYRKPNDGSTSQLGLVCR